MAKFKVGDKVKYKGDYPKIRGKSGTVSFVGIPGDDPTYLTVDMDNGEEWGAPEKDWSFMNSRACNAVVANALNATRVACNRSMIFELAKKYIEKNDDFGGVIDILKQDDNLMPNYAPSLWAGAMAKAKRYYDAGNKATPEQKKELVSMLSRLIANSKTSSNASCVARNGYVDIYTIAKQEWNRAYRGNEPFGVDAEIKPNGDFKIQEIAHGKVDDSEVDWNPIADKVKRALLAAGNKSAVVKVNPYGNGIVGNLGIARNACGTARNSATVTIGAGYAARVQHAMRDIARGYGARIIGSNVLACSDEDEAEDIVELLKKEYKVPEDEVWINAKRMARNDMTSKMFGSVKVYYNPGAPTPLELKFVDGIDGEKTFGEVLEVLKDAEDYRQTYKARIAGLDQAIAWIKQHAK